MQLRQYQQQAIDSLYYWFSQNTGDPIIVAPTGSGKSVIIGALCRDILSQYPNQRVLILSHVKELLQQNFEKIKTFWPQAPAGLYCAGLGVKRPRDPITVGSIQSVHKKAAALGWRDLILIDECHLLSSDSDSLYRSFIAAMREINPKLKVVGFTATPYRLRTGLLTEGKGRLFTDIAFEITLSELLIAGHICPLVSKSSAIQADLSGVRITAGEFNSGDLERAIDKELLTRAALDEVFSLAGNRKSWLFFCSGVKHAEHVRDAIRERGIICEAVTGETPAAERDAILAAFKDGRIQAVTNANVLTTGFDAPNIDLLVMLRATTSPGLYVQILGRGMRLHPSKQNCMVLDFAGNIERHGPITHVQPPRASVSRTNKQEQDKPMCLICPKCRMASPLGSMECADCGHSFARPEVVKHETTASDLEVMPANMLADGSEWVSVNEVRYMRHEKEGKIPSLRVEYTCGLLRVSEWICLFHPPGFAAAKAREWWKLRSDGEMPPGNLGTAVMMATGLKKPHRVRIKKNGKYWEVLGYEFNENAPGATSADAGRAHPAA